MKKRRITALPMIVVVAVVALVLGSFGSAVAKPVLSKSKIKSIAAKVVKKQAPTLSVANAANAAALNGLPGSAFQDRVAQASADVGSPVAVSTGSDTQILGPTNLTVPAGVNFVHATAQATFAGATTLYVYVSQDAACGAGGPGFTNRAFGQTTGQHIQTFQLVFPVTPGVHTYRLCARVGAAGVNAYSRSMVVETLSTGASGGSTISKPSSGGSPLSGDPTVVK
jgi:hypothetical protein